MSAALRVSDKVVCIAAIKSVKCCVPVPEVGAVYVVREVDDSDNGEQGIRLVGIRGGWEAGEEVWLHPCNFRRIPSSEGEAPAPALVERTKPRPTPTARRRNLKPIPFAIVHAAKPPAPVMRTYVVPVNELGHEYAEEDEPNA